MSISIGFFSCCSDDHRCGFLIDMPHAAFHRLNACYVWRGVVPNDPDQNFPNLWHMCAGRDPTRRNLTWINVFKGRRAIHSSQLSRHRFDG